MNSKVRGITAYVFVGKMDKLEDRLSPLFGGLGGGGSFLGGSCFLGCGLGSGFLGCWSLLGRRGFLSCGGGLRGAFGDAAGFGFA